MRNQETKEQKLERLYTSMEAADRAFQLTSNPAFEEVWKQLEDGLMDRWLALEITPDADNARWRVWMAIKVVRQLRDGVLRRAHTRQSLEQELKALETGQIPGA